ncbi:acyl-CoA desaturase [Aspergillus homomorphus CBS 101889]|uniref:Fatty acid desaturase domain-containing protein n=1 Tax=Aspergillus homomorphus (strain CBS 101889) TaxID=1450537 RepID=A0A395HV70_ASPHC|nr:hypothetical protein BO97DRAFT_471036 [Aspergillus homomorphus CBS 101889]RAL11275.1 hypothetical protein BO97DRAFT_471036 [Aspergillus homomorphus CBS 101889]
MASTTPGNRKPRISELPITVQNWHRHVDWYNTTFVVIIPLFGCIAAGFTPLQQITSHRTYNASLPLRIFLACGGGSAVQGSIRWWSIKHRAHHRWIDTKKDPYNIRQGLLHSHLLWLVLKHDPKNSARTDISDLNEDPVVVWQHRYYKSFMIGFGLIFPMIVAGLGWGDWKGGLVYAGILRMFLQQAFFCVNSLAHWMGDQGQRSPRNHLITALITLGEGYHNFHHELKHFPSDYRSGIEWWQYDPTKWAIWIWTKLGLASDLRRFRTNEIEMGRVQQLPKRLDQRTASLDRSVLLDQLSVVDLDDYVAEAQLGRTKASLADDAHDVTIISQDATTISNDDP